MTTITDDFMREMLAKSRTYSIVILKPGPRGATPEAGPIIWEHARRNFALRAEGKLPVVCPVTEGAGVNGVGIFAAGIDETRQIMDGDPGVQAGIFVYEVYGCRSFPGDKLP